MPRRKTATSYGGKRGNKSGDPKKAGEAGADAKLMRLRMRQAMARQIQHLEAIADGSLTVYRPFGKDADLIQVEPDFADRIKAIDTLGKYGIGPAPQAVELTGKDGADLPPQMWVFGAKPVKF